MNRVKTVEKKSPPTIIVASGAHVSDLPPRPIAIGRRPNIVVTDVNTIGLRRTVPADKIDRQRLRPDCRALLMKLINTRASFTTIPASATIPYIVAMVNGLSIMRRPAMAPINANGIEKKLSKVV